MNRLVDYIEQLRTNAGMSKTELSIAMGKRHGYWSDVTKMGPDGIGWRKKRSGRHHIELYIDALAVFNLCFYVGPREEQK